ncbi:MAG: hypothetical protein Q8L81_05425 [Bacteroidota bacterium]|nr:hypothetical protein [Bacteroidota bacterium]
MNKIVSKDLSYSGFCQVCDKTHSLPSEKAIAHCFDLMTQLRAHCSIALINQKENTNLRLSTANLYSTQGGEMFGVLVCEDANGNEVILRAFSSTHNGLWNVEGWAPHLVSENDFMEIVKKGNLEIHPLTKSIDRLEKKSEQWLLKTTERKSISQNIHKQLFDLYEVTNFKKEKRSLADALINKKRIPNGTGDCCAPKLLNYASTNNLKPVSIAEFYWGRTSPSGDKVEGEFYSSCIDKCQPLLGFMMCGIEDL